MKKTAITCMMLGVVSYSNAFSITDYYHEQSRCHYKAYCFNKEEAARLRPWVDGAADLSALLLVPFLVLAQ